MNKQQALDKLAEEIRHCEICKQGKSGKAVPGEGNPDADMVFIGEAPGKTEAATGRPFVGRSGQLLRSFIRIIGLKEEDVYITSPVKYLPDRPARNAKQRVAGGGTPTQKDISHGRTHLMKQFAVIQPKFVVLLGRVAAEGVLQNPTSSRRAGLRGARKVSIAKEHGKVIEENGGFRYFLTYHPAAALRFPEKLKALLKEDSQTVKELLQDRN